MHEVTVFLVEKCGCHVTGKGAYPMMIAQKLFIHLLQSQSVYPRRST